MDDFIMLIWFFFVIFMPILLLAAAGLAQSDYDTAPKKITRLIKDQGGTDVSVKSRHKYDAKRINRLQFDYVDCTGGRQTGYVYAAVDGWGRLTGMYYWESPPSLTSMAYEIEQLRAELATVRGDDSRPRPLPPSTNPPFQAVPYSKEELDRLIRDLEAALG